MTFQQLAKTRYSVRSYSDESVSDEQLNYILSAQKDRHSSFLTSSQIQNILDAELQYGIQQGYYEEEE